MTPTAARRHAPGSALILVVLLLLVMSIVAASAVTLSSQGRINAAAHTSHDALVECATAAQAQLWSALAIYGKSYYSQPSTTMTVTSIRLPDGRDLMAPAHLDSSGAVHPAEGIRSIVAGAPSGYFADVDTTNTMAGGGGMSGQNAIWVTATCRDSSGRIHEVEFAFRFSL